MRYNEKSRVVVISAKSFRHQMGKRNGTTSTFLMYQRGSMSATTNSLYCIKNLSVLNTYR